MEDDIKKVSEECNVSQEKVPGHICVKCGMTMAEEQLFCPRCGQKVQIEKQKKERKPLTEKQKRYIKIAAIVAGVLVIILTVCFYVLPKFVLPKAYLSSANAAYEKEDYDKAFHFYDKLDKTELEAEVRQKYQYSQGKSLYQDAEYVKAAESFSWDTTYLDSTECIYDCGTQLIKNEQYADAVTVFSMISTDDSVVGCNYAKGMNAYENKEYEEAIDLLETVKGQYEGVDEFLLQVYYEYGKSLFDSNDYKNASSQFVKAGNYSDAVELDKTCTFLIAEEHLKNGELNQAKSLYNELNRDFSHNGVSVSQRLVTLEQYSSFVSICGKWVASQNYVESRNVYKRNGSWNNWYVSDVNTSQTITVRCYLNSDGTMTIAGTGSFLRFTDYSSLSAYCKAKQNYISFKISNVTSIPGSYTIADNTLLKYSNGVFSIDYSVRDDYSAYFYNLYNSNVTYGNRTATY